MATDSKLYGMDIEYHGYIIRLDIQQRYHILSIATGRLVAEEASFSLAKKLIDGEIEVKVRLEAQSKDN